jgi:HK97 family phage major capsid protein
MTTESTVGREEFDALKGDIGSMAERLDKLLAALADSAPLKRAGYLAPDSEADHPEVKSFGDFLIAVKRGNTRRLAEVYKSIKDMTEGAGQQGGYLVPVEFANTLLRVNPEENPVLSRVRRVPVAVESGRYPALDMFAAPTAGSGNTAFAGGLTAATTAEGGTLTETQATFEEIAWNINKIGGYVEVTNELVSDSPISVEALLSDLFRLSINAKLERHILRGNGAGEPLGVLNSSVAVASTTAGDNVFAEADALAMLARFKPVGGAPVWVMHRSVIPDLGAFSDTTSAMVNWQSGVSMQLLGYPIAFSEHMPQANGDDVLLADFGGYLLFERQGLQIAYSEHAAFTTDKGTWRFTYRCDGKPWLRSAVTLADPTGSYTVSPFVYHDD